MSKRWCFKLLKHNYMAMRKIKLDDTEEKFLNYMMRKRYDETFSRSITNKLHFIRQHITDSEIITCGDADKIVISILGEDKYRKMSWCSKKNYKKSVNDFITFSKELNFYNSTNL